MKTNVTAHEMMVLITLSIGPVKQKCQRRIAIIFLSISLNMLLGAQKRMFAYFAMHRKEMLAGCCWKVIG